MKKIYYVFLFASAVLFASCTEYKVKKMSKQLVVALNENDSTTIADIYPNSRIAKAFADNLEYDSLSVEEIADTMIVHINNGKAFYVAKNDDGDLKVVDSRGVFVFSERMLDIGEQTGWVSPTMSDMEKAEQFADSVFVHYLADKTHRDILSSFVELNVLLDFSYKEYDNKLRWNILVRNSSYSLLGSDYNFIVDVTPALSITVPGIDLDEEDLNYRITKFKTEIAEFSPKVRVEFTISDEELLRKYGWFGFSDEKEYETYLKSPLYKKR